MRLFPKRHAAMNSRVFPEAEVNGPRDPPSGYQVQTLVAWDSL